MCNAQQSKGLPDGEHMHATGSGVVAEYRFVLFSKIHTYLDFKFAPSIFRDLDGVHNVTS